MPLDSSNFPMVWMHYETSHDHDHEDDFAIFEANLKRETPFVILSDTAPTEDHEHTQDEKKRTALWMKKHKGELRRLVRAMIVIEPSATKRLAFKTFALAFSKFWGYPLKLVTSRDEALELAQDLLSEPANARLHKEFG
ncbi:MAG: hypothetical protein AAGD15_09945 [Agrobacterium cavarae]|uniref:hypothetical protein n=1 Tax=Agrobacterium cavarae TaxID=2528239 RepID=UPI0031AFF2DA